MESSENDIHMMCKQAYYDVLYEHISRTPPDYELLIDLFGEIKTRLSSILKKDSPLRLEIEEKLDEKLFQQMICNNAYNEKDFQDLVEYTFEKCKQLGSAARDAYTDEKKNEILNAYQQGATFSEMIVLYIRNIHDCLDFMNEDLHTFLNSENIMDDQNAS